MNSITIVTPQDNSVFQGALKHKKVYGLLDEVTGEHFIKDIGYAFEIGACMADYELRMQDDFSPPKSEEISKTAGIFLKYTDTTFISENKELPTGSTVGLFSIDGLRTGYAIVLWPGKNIVYYISSSIWDVKTPKIDLHASDIFKKACGIEIPWTADNICDKVRTAGLFGMVYNKAANEIVLPSVRLTSAASYGVLIAEEARNDYLRQQAIESLSDESLEHQKSIKHLPR